MSDLPPLDQQQAYVVVGSNEQVGPYALELLISEVVAGRLADTTPVWWPPLADWTTMSMHPGVAAEIARRRSATGAAPAWAAPAAPVADPVPGPVPQTFAEPAHNQDFTPQGFTPQASTGEPSTSTPSASDPYGTAPAAASVFDSPTATPFDSPSESATDIQHEDVVDAEVVDAEIVDASAVDAAAVDPSVVATDAAEENSPEQASPEQASTVSHANTVESGLVDDDSRATFNALVERSSRRADSVARVVAADELFVQEVISAATSLSFGLDDRTDVDRRHELRFGEPSGDLLVISLGQIAGTDVETIRSSVLPVTVSYRADGATTPTAATQSDGVDHGAIVITPDEWTGQTTSSVSLYLAVDDYLAEDLTLLGDSLSRDVQATIKSVRARLT